MIYQSIQKVKDYKIFTSKLHAGILTFGLTASSVSLALLNPQAFGIEKPLWATEQNYSRNVYCAGNQLNSAVPAYIVGRFDQAKNHLENYSTCRSAANAILERLDDETNYRYWHSIETSRKLDQKAEELLRSIKGIVNDPSINNGEKYIDTDWIA